MEERWEGRYYRNPVNSHPGLLCYRAKPGNGTTLILRRMPRMPEGVSFEHILVLATSVATGQASSVTAALTGRRSSALTF